MRVRLTSLDAVALLEEVLLYNFPAVAGRSLDVDIQINDTWLSRRHCEFREEDGDLIVRDLDSSNGTYVNGERVEEAKMVSGDTITIGLSSFLVSFVGETSDSGEFVCSQSDDSISIEDR